MAHEVVKSVGRVLAVLELFERQREPLTATEICGALEYPASSTDALLKSMLSLGYLALNTQTRRYFPSLRVTRLGEWIPTHLFQGDTMELLDTLHEATGETVTLSAQSDLHMQFVRVLPGTFPISLRITEGYIGPLFGSAVGTAYLSRLNDRQIDRLMQRGKRTPGSASKKIAFSEVMKEVEETRQRGYAVGYDRILQDTGAIAMPLQDNQNFVVAVGGLSPRIRRSESSIIRQMRKAIRYMQKSA